MDTIDFVLVWDSSTEANNGASADTAAKKRLTFEQNLKKIGLKLKEQANNHFSSQNLHFISISAPKDVLCTYCEILKIRLPLKAYLAKQLLKHGKNSQEYEDPADADEFDEEFLDFMEEVDIEMDSKTKQGSVSSWQKFKQRYFKINPLIIPTRYKTTNSKRLTAVYSRQHQYLFDTEEINSGLIFSSNIKRRVIDFILKRTHFIEHGGGHHENPEEEEDVYNFGIEKLIKDGVYSTAFPLHDGQYNNTSSPAGTTEYTSLRSFLYNEWSSLTKLFKYQPLNLIKEYFGVRIGLYYSWLGFYTWMLLPISILGFVCFLYGLGTLHNNSHVQDVCNKTSGIIMCPLCNKYCGYWNLSNTCLYSKLTYMFDNDSTVIYAVLMSLWTILFLEQWKRYSASLFYRWNLSSNNTSSSDQNNEHPRLEYITRLSKVKKTRLNQITQKSEPVLSFYKHKLPKLIFSGSISWFLISLAIVAVLGIILYRLSIKVIVLKAGGSGNNNLSTKSTSSSLAILFVNISAVFINLIFILTFNQLYSYLATYLTEMELHRTQSEFDTSLTLKIYCLQFVNFYSSIFYIAFFKGKFSGSPPNYNTLFGYRNEECSPGGCMSELCIQLAIIMIGKQVLNASVEMTMPIIKQFVKKYITNGNVGGAEGSATGNNNQEQHQRSETLLIPPSSLTVGLGTCKKVNATNHVPSNNAQWIEDYELLEWNSRSLFPEYLEMILQFGFIVIFSSAFPLGPLFALLNNIFEMRLDGKKMLRYFRRPISSGSIGDFEIWIIILNVIAKLGVISNGFIIAFTSSFIPKLIYRLETMQSKLDGFLEFSLAKFNTSEFDHITKPSTNSLLEDHVEICRYESYYRSDEETGGLFYWKIMLARFIFVVVFQNFVFSCQVLLEWLIPDVPKELNDKIRQEEYLTNEMIIWHEQRQQKKAKKNKIKPKTTRSKSRSTSRSNSNFSGSISPIGLITQQEMKEINPMSRKNGTDKKTCESVENLNCHNLSDSHEKVESNSSSLEEVNTKL